MKIVKFKSLHKCRYKIYDTYCRFGKDAAINLAIELTNESFKTCNEFLEMVIKIHNVAAINNT